MFQGLSNCCGLREFSPSLGQSLPFAQDGTPASVLQLLVLGFGFIQAMVEASPPSFLGPGVQQLSVGVSAPSPHQ